MYIRMKEVFQFILDETQTDPDLQPAPQAASHPDGPPNPLLLYLLFTFELCIAFLQSTTSEQALEQEPRRKRAVPDFLPKSNACSNTMHLPRPPPAHLSLQMQIYFLFMTMRSQTHFLDWCEQQPVYIWLLVSFFERGTVCKTLLLYASLCFIIIFCAKPLPNLIVVFEKHDDTVTVFLFIYK